MKKVFANVVAVIVVGPVWPFYLMAMIGDKAPFWNWPDFFLSRAERIVEWGER